MLQRVVMLAMAVGLLGVAAEACTPGYAGSGYYRQRDCGLRLGARAYASSGYTYGYSYGAGYGVTIDSVIPTLYGPPLSYGYRGGYPAGYAGFVPHIPNWYVSPYGGRSPGVSVAPGLRHSPRARTRLRVGSIRPGLRSGLGELARTKNRSYSTGMTQLADGVWINP